MASEMKPAPPVIKLSSPPTREFWEIPVVWEDAHLLAINKPARLLTSPDRYDPKRPNLMRLLHEAIAAGKPWAAERQLQYLSNAHRLDFETTGVLLLAKDRPSLVHLANQFGSEVPRKTYVTLVQGTPKQDRFTVDKPLAPDHFKPGMMRVSRAGKKSVTEFVVLEKFRGVSLVEAHPKTGRTHQIRVHLKHLGAPIVGDALYGGLADARAPRQALHAWRLELSHPADAIRRVWTSAWPTDLVPLLEAIDIDATDALRRAGRAFDDPVASTRA